jgi:hypothetical protein
MGWDVGLGFCGGKRVGLRDGGSGGLHQQRGFGLSKHCRQ